MSFLSHLPYAASVAVIAYYGLPLFEFLFDRIIDIGKLVSALLVIISIIDRIDSYYDKDGSNEEFEKTKSLMQKSSDKVRAIFKKQFTSNFNSDNRNESSRGGEHNQEVLTSSQCLQKAWGPNLPLVICDAAGRLIDIIMRDFIDMWFVNITDTDRSFPNSVQETLVHAIGELLMRANKYLNPIEFALHKGSLLLRKHISLYSKIRRSAALKHPEAFVPDKTHWWSNKENDLERQKASVEATNKRNFYITEELRIENLLHPAFNIDGIDSNSPIDLNDVMTMNGTKPSASELKYLRFIANKIIKKLLKEQDIKCFAVKLLVRELIVNSVLTPVINLINSDNLNIWILNGFDMMNKKPDSSNEVSSTSTDLEIKSKLEDCIDSGDALITNVLTMIDEEPLLFDTSMASMTTLDPSLMNLDNKHDTREDMEEGCVTLDVISHYRTSGVPPKVFRPTKDRSWRHLAGDLNETAAEVLLNDEAPGTFLLRKTKPHSYNAGSHQTSSTSASGNQATDLDSYALSYVASGGVSTDDECGNSFVVHALLRCNPGSFEYCGVASGSGGGSGGGGISVSSNGDNVSRRIHDPRLVDRGHELLDPFPSLHKLLKTLDDLCNFGLVFYPEDDEDDNHWEDILEGEKNCEIDADIISLEIQKEAENEAKRINLNEIENDIISSDNANRSDSNHSLINDRSDGFVSEPIEENNSILKNDTNDSINDVNVMIEKEQSEINYSSETNINGDINESVLDDQDVDKKGEIGEIEGDNDEKSLWDEQHRHVLLIELQAAVENVEEYDGRCLISTAQANDSKNKESKTPFGRRSKSGNKSGSQSSDKYKSDGMMDHHWNRTEGIRHLGRLIVALDAVFSHGFKDSAASGVDGFSEGGEGAEEPTFFMRNWYKNTNNVKLGERGISPGNSSGVFISNGSAMEAGNMDYFSRHTDAINDGEDDRNGDGIQVCGGGNGMIVVQEDDSCVDLDEISSMKTTEEKNTAQSNIYMNNDSVETETTSRSRRLSLTEQSTMFYHTYLLCEDSDQNDQNQTEANATIVIAEKKKVKKNVFQRSFSANEAGLSQDKGEILIAEGGIFDTVRQILNILAPIAPMAVDSGVDVAGRGWIVAALSQGLLKDRLYRLIADPRRTRDYYHPGAVLREPNDSSRLLWLLERLNFISRYQSNIPKLMVLICSLEIDHHELLASRSLYLVHSLHKDELDRLNSINSQNNQIKLPMMFTNAMKSIDSALTFNQTLRKETNAVSKEANVTAANNNPASALNRASSLPSKSFDTSNNQLVSNSEEAGSEPQFASNMFEGIDVMKSLGAVTDSMVAPVKFVSMVTHRSVSAAAAAAGANRGGANNEQNNDLRNLSRYSKNLEFCTNVRTRNEAALKKILADNPVKRIKSSPTSPPVSHVTTSSLSSLSSLPSNTSGTERSTTVAKKQTKPAKLEKKPSSKNDDEIIKNLSILGGSVGSPSKKKSSNSTKTKTNPSSSFPSSSSGSSPSSSSVVTSPPLPLSVSTSASSWSWGTDLIHSPNFAHDLANDSIIPNFDGDDMNTFQEPSMLNLNGNNGDKMDKLKYIFNHFRDIFFTHMKNKASNDETIIIPYDMLTSLSSLGYNLDISSFMINSREEGTNIMNASDTNVEQNGYFNKNSDGNLVTASILRIDFIHFINIVRNIISREYSLIILKQSLLDNPKKSLVKKCLAYLLRPSVRTSILKLKEKFILRPCSFDEMTNLSKYKLSCSIVNVEHNGSMDPLLEDLNDASITTNASGSSGDASESVQQIGSQNVISEAMSSIANTAGAAFENQHVTYEIQVCKINQHTKLETIWKIKKRYTDFRTLHLSLLHESLKAQLYHDWSEQQNGIRGVLGKVGNGGVDIDDSDINTAISSNSSLNEHKTNSLRNSIRGKMSVNIINHHEKTKKKALFLQGRLNHALPTLPPKRAFGNTEKEFVQSRKKKLNEYLNLLLLHPVFGECHELTMFLDAQIDRHEDITKNDTSSVIDQSSSLLVNVANENKVRGLNNNSKNDDVPIDDDSLDIGQSTGFDSLQRQSKNEVKSNLTNVSNLTDKNIKTELKNTKEMDSVLLKRIQQLIYLLLKELLELDRKNLMRRNIVSFLRKAVKVMFTNKISGLISSLGKKFNSDETTSKFINWIVNTIWNEPGSIMGPPRSIFPTQMEIFARQYRLKIEFLKIIPTSFSSLLGGGNCDTAAINLYEFIQCSVLIRSLLYSALDMLWYVLFPDEELDLRSLHGNSITDEES